MKILLSSFIVCVLLSGAVAQDNSDCMECHSDADLTTTINDTLEKSLFVDEKELQSSIHADLDCIDCHATDEDHPDTLPGEPKCASCHDDVEEIYAQSIHGKAYYKGDLTAATCWSCHGSHNIVPHSEHSGARMMETCGACHSKPEVMHRFGRRELDPIKSFKQSIHGQIFVDDPNAPVANCIECHGAHDIKPTIESDARLNKLNIPKTCGNCHPDEEAEYYDSIHWKSLLRGRVASPVCTDCHGEHNIHLAESVEAGTTPGMRTIKLCSNCHSSETLMAKFGLDYRRLSSYLKSYHGLAVMKGSPEAATCTSCHEVHAIRSSRDSLSSVYPSNLKRTCGTCHQNVSAEFASIDVHPIDQQTRNPFAWWLKNFYIWMIIVVIGGMFLHNLIIMIHHVRQKRQQEKGQIRYTRFQSWEVYQHFFMFTSFILLAITGFALKFPDAAWVQGLVSLGMSEAVRSLLHRISAVVMLVTSIIQLFYFIFTHRGRREFLSLLPTIDDIKHVWQNMRYHLGMSSERPQFGRYDYGEKAEYLALIWGVIVMGVTGMVLWFPEFFFSFLPGWVFEASEVVHYFEAWLATLAIVVWHWFFVIYHPDNYPINTTVLDGKITEENLKHHHPAEYKRILEESADKE